MLSLSVALFLLLGTARVVYTASQPGSSSLSTGNFAPPEIQHSWASYTPYFSVQNYVPPPSTCTITQVNIIQRHGARYPTSNSGQAIQAALAKLQSVAQYTDPRLDFLKSYAYGLGTADLVPFGALQSAQAGEYTFRRYRSLVSPSHIPFVRSSGGQRVVDSATNWTAGFSIASDHVYDLPLSVILSEALNNTLDDNMCPGAGPSYAQTEEWTSIFGTPIADRLNSQAPGANIVAADIPSLISLCPFETLAKEKLSPFCGLFTAAEFGQFEYYGDLGKYYGTGYGQELGPVQGVGYINELIARLTGQPVQDNTQTNRTLDSSPVTFPLDRTIYADFSHDNQMIAIYAAMGLFKQAQLLDLTKPDPQRTWIISQLTPFSARMVTERLSCKGRGKATEYVRILVNDALQPLEFCGGDRNGICELGAFVKSQRYARNDGDGDFEKCFS